MFKKTLYLVVLVIISISLCYAEDFILEGNLEVEGVIKGEGDGETPKGYILEPTFLDFWEGTSEYPFSMRIERVDQALHLYHIAEGVTQPSWIVKSVINGYGLRIGNDLTVFNENIDYENSPYKLAVDGTILAKEVQVKSDVTWPDYVFEDDYQLPKLNELESFIVSNKHLPNIPSKEKVAEEGFGLAEMQAKLLQKIEELTLYIIDLQKQNDALAEKVEGLSKTE